MEFPPDGGVVGASRFACHGSIFRCVFLLFGACNVPTCELQLILDSPEPEHRRGKNPAAQSHEKRRDILAEIVKRYEMSGRSVGDEWCHWVLVLNKR